MAGEHPNPNLAGPRAAARGGCCQLAALVAMTRIVVSTFVLR